MSKIILVANWKMNPASLKKAKELFFLFERAAKKTKNVKVVVCPPFLFLTSLKSKAVALGAQNCYFEKKGAFTGEISPLMLKNLGIKYVILGHSERRKYFGESNELIFKKLLAAISAKLVPILCCGETEKERKEGKTFLVLKKQLSFLKKFKNLEKKMILAYEPVWAIGTKNPCEPEKAKKVLDFLKKFFSGKILYGGSVTLKNAKDYIRVGFEGLLVGGFSLKKEFAKLIEILAYGFHSHSRS